jgi:hypothetical protein
MASRATGLFSDEDASRAGAERALVRWNCGSGGKPPEHLKQRTTGARGPGARGGGASATVGADGVGGRGAGRSERRGNGGDVGPAAGGHVGA